MSFSLKPFRYQFQTRTPLLIPNRSRTTFPFHPFQNPCYFPPHPSPPMQQFQPSGPWNSFHPPPGLNLPSIPAEPWSGSDVHNISSVARSPLSSRLSIDVTRAKAYSRDHVETNFTTAKTYSGNFTDDDCTHLLGSNEEIISQVGNVNFSFIRNDTHSVATDFTETGRICDFGNAG